jgi:hypothetical protein
VKDGAVIENPADNLSPGLFFHRLITSGEFSKTVGGRHIFCPELTRSYAKIIRINTISVPVDIVTGPADFDSRI